MTILAHGAGLPADELLAEIAAVNDTGPNAIRLMSPLMPGEARDLQENIRAQNQLRSRETMVHALVTQILLDWCATAAGQSRSDVLQRLALTLDAWLGQPGPPAGESLTPAPHARRPLPVDRPRRGVTLWHVSTNGGQQRGARRHAARAEDGGRLRQLAGWLAAEHGIQAEAEHVEESGGRYRWVLAWYDGPADLPRLGDKAADLGLDTRRFGVARVITGPALAVTAARIAVRGDLPLYPDPARLAEAITAEARGTDDPGRAASSAEESLAAQLAGIAGERRRPGRRGRSGPRSPGRGRSLRQHRAEGPAGRAGGPAGRHHGGPGGTGRPGPGRARAPGPRWPRWLPRAAWRPRSSAPSWS